MDDFVDTFLARLAGRTRQNHMYTLRRLAAWLDARGRSIIAAGRQDVEEWVAARRSGGVSGCTVCSDLGHIGGYYRWLVETGIRGDDPVALVRRPRRERSDRPWLGRADVARLLDASASWSGGELAAHVHLWALSGLRPGEPRLLRVGDVSVHDGATTVRVTASKTPGKETVVIPDSTARLLAESAGARLQGPLLLNPRTGRAWTKAAERARFQRLIAEAGLPRITPYGLRVSFITLALSAGISERSVSIAARHASTAQTSRYDRLRAQVAEPVAPRLEEWLHSVQETALTEGAP